jgi:hypothetical protein
MGGGRARKGTGAAADFGATDAVKEALRALGTAEEGGVLVTIQAEHLDVAGLLPEGTASALAAAVKAQPEPEPIFALLRYVPASAASGGSVLVLCSFCPEDTPVRKRMIHASAKPALRSLLLELELEILKSVETQDPDDLTDEWLAERVGSGVAGAAEGGAVAELMLGARRPAPKGGRRVMRTPTDKPEDA